MAEFQAKLTRLTFLDPACGCGNFLVIAYREIRRLELEALKAQYGDQQIDAALLSRVTVDQFYGIEFEEFPARIAEVAMWMMDHIANNAINEAFRLNYARIPLKESAHILHGDALEADWAALLPPEKCSYIMGNPPFVGAKYQTAEQRAQVRRIAGLGGSGGTLDYVAAWFIKAGQYVQANRRIRIGLVATNSISQGEQVAQLWPILFDRHGLEIAFAHRTFSWGSEARGKAHVHVVIIGLAHREHEPGEKRLFSYPDIKADPVETRHGALTAYLFDARGVANRHLVVREESRPINGARRVKSGVQMIDNGVLTFTYDEMSTFLEREPKAKPLFRQFIGGDEYINGFTRWILYLADADPALLRSLPLVTERMRELRAYRASSARPSTQAMAKFPTRLSVDERLTRDYLVVPNTSSERRDYVPIGWLGPDVIASQKLRILADASHWEFAILTSRAHMAWLAHIGGRLESRFSYTHGLVYNTFPWPDGHGRAAHEGGGAGAGGARCARRASHRQPRRPLRSRHHAREPQACPRRARCGRRQALSAATLRHRPRPGRAPVRPLRGAGEPLGTPRSGEEPPRGAQGRPVSRAQAAPKPRLSRTGQNARVSASLAVKPSASAVKGSKL